MFRKSLRLTDGRAALSLAGKFNDTFKDLVTTKEKKLRDQNDRLSDA